MHLALARLHFFAACRWQSRWFFDACRTVSALLFIVTSLVAAEPVTLVTSDFATHPRQPQIAIDQQGIIYLAFASAESIYVCRSEDRGITYGSPVEVSAVPKLALGLRRGPRITANQASIVVTAISHASGDLFAWHSVDRGKTWSGPVLINDSPRVAREGLHAMATGKDGFIYCSWLDLRNERTQIFGASSSDGGQTWSENRQVYASPSGTVCECCHPSVAIDSAGAIYIMWRNVIAGNRDMFMAVSDDRGQTFTPARKLGVGSWKLNACPMDGGFLAVADEGQFSTVWRRDQQVFRVDDHRHSKLFVEQRLGSGEQPWVAATSKGMMVVWLSRRGGELWLSRSATHAPEKLADQASDPVIAATCTGNGPIVVAWETGTQPNTSILTTILFDETE